MLTGAKKGRMQCSLESRVQSPESYEARRWEPKVRDGGPKSKPSAFFGIVGIEKVDGRQDRLIVGYPGLPLQKASSYNPKRGSVKKKGGERSKTDPGPKPTGTG